jgi:ABC-2 type transport system permease protein
MPFRVAMGAATWWDLIIAVVLSLATIVGLVALGGRVYTHVILHTGASLTLRAAWRDLTARPALEPPVDPQSRMH